MHCCVFLSGDNHIGFFWFPLGLGGCLEHTGSPPMVLNKQHFSDCSCRGCYANESVDFSSAPNYFTLQESEGMRGKYVKILNKGGDKERAG